MPYIGKEPANSFISFEKQVFTIVNSQTAYTLDNAVTNENDIRLVINNIVQEPGSGKAYTASGTTLTLSAALVNGTDEMYCVFLGKAVQTVNAPAASVGTSQLAATSVTAAKLNNDIISGSTELASEPADTDEFLVSDAGTLKRIDYSLIKASSTPAFAAKMSGSQNISHNTSTKITVNTEIFDTDNAYDNSSNYRFTPQTAGKYYCTFNINSNANGQGNFRIANAQIYFNGSLAYISGYDKATGYENNGRESLSAIITFNGSSDYIEPYFYGYTQDSGNIEIGGSNTYDCQFSAYRIIGL